jgi:hypothetical protein
VLELVTWAAVAFGSAGALSVCALAARRIVLARAQRRRNEA